MAELVIPKNGSELEFAPYTDTLMCEACTDLCAGLHVTQLPLFQNIVLYGSESFINVLRDHGPQLVETPATQPGQPDSSSNREEQVTNVFNTIIRKGVIQLNTNTATVRHWCTPRNTLIGGNRKPDLILLDSRLQSVASLSWEHVRSVCRVKYRDTPELALDAFHQLYDNALSIFFRQDSRMFLYGLTLCGTTLRTYIFLRGSTVSCLGTSLQDCPVLTARILLGIATGSLEDIGYEPTMTTPTLTSYMNNDGLVERTMRLQDLVVIIESCLFSSPSIQGKGTRVFFCKPLVYKEWLSNPEPKDAYSGLRSFIVKDCWIDEGRHGDAYFHELMEKRLRYTTELPLGIPEFIASDQGLPNVTTASLLEELPVVSRNMSHKRYVFTTCGASLGWFSTVREFISVVIGAVKGHKAAYDVGILHRDVSSTNVMVTVEDLTAECVVPDPPQSGEPEGWRSGFLGDWGLAFDMWDESSSEWEQCAHTGTYPYLSTELMLAANGSPLVHRLTHDLESFFWVLWIVAINHSGPFDTTRNWRVVEHLLATIIAEERKTATELPLDSPYKKEVPLPQPGALSAMVLHPTVPSPTGSAQTTTDPSLRSSGAKGTEETAQEELKERLRKGLEFQLAALKDTVKEAETWKAMRQYEIHNIASISFLEWAKLGGHQKDNQQVAMQKAMLNWEMMSGLVNPYFAKKGFIDNMRKLYELFHGSLICKEGRLFWCPSKNEATHDQVLDILTTMQSSITDAEDPHPSPEVIKEARERFNMFLDAGRYLRITHQLSPSEPVAKLGTNQSEASTRQGRIPESQQSWSSLQNLSAGFNLPSSPCAGVKRRRESGEEGRSTRRKVTST